ncbi:unnamed protein product [Euphydryas editha]|uniref:Uncharacterized protein n=1 Tax=Euphydryas editha TaxID=104508 RepID=A0AAU9UAS8_EUPED|nr:unnamed protein product [Euphydryas editha]
MLPLETYFPINVPNAGSLGLGIKKIRCSSNCIKITSSFSVSFFIPCPTVQHFVWPLHWCLLADICNHTWIPECGTENEDDVYSRRLFIDECDMYEYNCDYESDYYAINYSDCFRVPATPCPSRPPCPSHPTCPDHRFHRMGQTYQFSQFRRMGKKSRSTTKVTLPMHMLRGKRRYTPTGRKKKRRATRTTVKMSSAIKINKKMSLTTIRTTILKNKEVTRNVKKVKAVKKFIKKPNKQKQDSDDFLE